MWFKYGLKAQKLQKQHALKGQKLLAQGVWSKTFRACGAKLSGRVEQNLRNLS